MPIDCSIGNFYANHTVAVWGIYVTFILNSLVMI